MKNIHINVSGQNDKLLNNFYCHTLIQNFKDYLSFLSSGFVNFTPLNKS